MITASQVNTTGVTDEQIGKCHKVFDGAIPFYQVESDSNDQVEYKVTWDKEHGFRCACKAGQTAFSNCREGICKHVKWTVAAAREEREAVAALYRAIAVRNAMSDPATIAAATLARETPTNVKRDRATAPYQPRAFSILR